VLVAVPNDIQAAAIVNALADRGIQATVTGSYTSGFRAEAPGWVSVVVRRMDLDLARQTLGELKPGTSDLGVCPRIRPDSCLFLLL
jgi:hypothetical protein